MSNGKFEEINLAIQNIVGSTAQLNIASRLEVNGGSNKFNEMRLASKMIAGATGFIREVDELLCHPVLLDENLSRYFLFSIIG